nr:probable pectinesterase/pectinesterase inhibitor 41 [Ipomoea batatas]
MANNGLFSFSPSALTSGECICNANPRPPYCGLEGLEPPMDGCSFHDVARKSFQYSLLITKDLFYRPVDDAFYRPWGSLSSVSPENNRMLSALESCEALIRENKKILFRTFQVIKCRDKLEDPSEARGMTDLLRSVVRNHETCFDALTGAAASANATTPTQIDKILSDLPIGSESFNASLEFFRLGWGQHQDQITHSAPSTRLIKTLFFWS